MPTAPRSDGRMLTYAPASGVSADAADASERRSSNAMVAVQDVAQMTAAVRARWAAVGALWAATEAAVTVVGSASPVHGAGSHKRSGRERVCGRADGPTRGGRADGAAASAGRADRPTRGGRADATVQRPSRPHGPRSGSSASPRATCRYSPRQYVAPAAHAGCTGPGGFGRIQLLSRYHCQATPRQSPPPPFFFSRRPGPIVPADLVGVRYVPGVPRRLRAVCVVVRYVVGPADRPGTGRPGRRIPHVPRPVPPRPSSIHRMRRWQGARAGL